MTAGLVSTAQGARYEQPPLGRLILNEVLDPATVSAPFLLYLSKRGRYYAELLLEPRDGAPNAALVAPWQVALDLVFMRGKQTIFQKSAVATFNPGDRGKTLFWLMAPSDVPERRELQLSVSMRSRADPMPVRLQVWRKLELLPVR